MELYNERKRMNISLKDGWDDIKISPKQELESVYSNC
jgi:hypothetical protein